MLQSLKQKTLVGKLWAIIVLAVAAIFIGVVFGPGIAKIIAGPTHFAPLDDHDVLSLQGQYLEADIDTLIDYYAEAVVADTERLIDDEDGSYEWDGSYVSVRGTLQPMDDETRQLWEDYFIDAGFSYDDIGLFDDCTALPLVLTDGEIDGQDTFVYGFMGVIGVLLVVLAIWFVVHSLTGGFQKQIRNYIKASDDPQATEQALDRFYEDTMQDGKVRMSRSWLMYDKGGNSWVLAGDDVVWAYQYTVRHKAYGILTVRKERMVRVFGAKEKRACHDIYVRNEDEAQEILQQMARTYPEALIGYDQDIERKYHANPAAFHQAVITARHAPAAPAAEPTEPAQEPESKPLYT